MLHRIGSNNNNLQNTVYGAVVMTKSLREFSRFICKTAADHQTKSRDLRCESVSRLLSSKPTIAIVIYHHSSVPSDVSISLLFCVLVSLVHFSQIAFMCFIVCIPLTRGHVCVCYFTRATVSAEQALSVLFT